MNMIGVVNEVTGAYGLDHPLERLILFLYGNIQPTVFNEFVREIAARAGAPDYMVINAFDEMKNEAKKVLRPCPICGGDKRLLLELCCDSCLAIAADAADTIDSMGYIVDEIRRRNRE